MTACLPPLSLTEPAAGPELRVSVTLQGLASDTRAGLSGDSRAHVAEVSAWAEGTRVGFGTLSAPSGGTGPWTGQIQISAEGPLLFEVQVFDADRVLLYDDFTTETISPGNRSVTITTSTRRASSYLGSFLEPRPRPYPFSLQASQEGWQRGSRFYHVWISGFHDTNGDGYGDLPGVTAKLDHIKDLGFNGFWLSPFFLSPSVTNPANPNKHGYDAKDFYEVDPLFGTKADLRTLLVEAHKRGLKVLLDYVPNHSSDEHVWFQKSLANEPGKRDWYVWTSTEPQPPWYAWDYPGHNPSNFNNYSEDWYFSSQRNQWYYALFPMPSVLGQTPPQWSKMPDLNYERVEVRSAMADVMAYWMNFGFDGLRVDAIPYAFEGAQNDPASYEYQGKSYKLYRHWRAEVLNAYGPLGYHKFMVGENYHDKDSSYFANRTANLFSFVGPGNTALSDNDRSDGGFQMAFDFQFRWRLDSLLSSPGTAYIELANLMEAHSATEESPKGSAASFLSNHDEFFERIAYTYPDWGRQRQAIAIHALGPLIPFYYYGTEVAMTYPSNEVYRPNDLRLRKLMPWGPELETQLSDPQSILSWTRALYRTRGALSDASQPNYSAFADPEFKNYWVHYSNDVFSFAVKNLSTGNFAWMVFNLSSNPKSNHQITMHEDVRFTSNPQLWLGSGTTSLSGNTLTLNGTLPARAIRVYAPAAPPAWVTEANPGDVGTSPGGTLTITVKTAGGSPKSLKFPGDFNGWNIATTQTLSVAGGAEGSLAIPDAVSSGAMALGDDAAKLELKVVSNPGEWINAEDYSGWSMTNVSLADSGRQVQVSTVAGQNWTLTIDYTTNSLTAAATTVDPTANANLAALSLSAGALTPGFHTSTQSYSLSVANGTSSTTVTASPAAAGANLHLRLNGGSWTALTAGSTSGAQSLNVGSNTLDLRVTAQNGTTTKVYTVTVTRASTGGITVNIPASYDEAERIHYWDVTPGSIPGTNWGNNGDGLPLLVNTETGWKGYTVADATAMSFLFKRVAPDKKTSDLRVTAPGTYYVHYSGGWVVTTVKPNL